MQPNPPPRLRCYQYSLRSLLIFIALLSIPLAWIVKEREQSRREIQLTQQFNKPGGDPFLMLGGPYDSLELDHQTQGWWRDLARKILGERIVKIYGEMPDSKNLSQLAGLQKLQTLNLRSTPVSDLTPLAGLINLRKLY